MSRPRPLLVPADAERPRVHLRFDETLVEADLDHSLASALLSAGVLMTSRSPKYRRPRGAFCLSGDCGTCLVRVDGQPNVRACMTELREGMRAAAQNSYQPTRLDPTALVDKIFPSGFDHHHFFVRPRVVNQVMQAFARNLTGFGELPEGAAERDHAYLAHELPVLIIGAGAAGRAAAALLEEVGVEYMIVDRLPPRALRTQLCPAPAQPPALPERLLPRTGVFGIYPGPRHALPGHEHALALVAASERSEDHERLHAFRPRHLLLCMGARESMIPFANNDLPGVVAARGLVRTLHRAHARIAARCVVVGKGARAQSMREQLDALRAPGAPQVELVEPARVERASGSDRVEALECKGEKINCSLVALAGPLVPASELAAQAGARLRFDGEGFRVERSASDTGQCGELGGTQLWAAGDVCGWVGDELAARDGVRVAKALLIALARERGEALDLQRFEPEAPPQPPQLREKTVVGDRFAEPEPREDPS